MKQRAYGFTIVELLIVIVVIAILAAITIVAYNGIQDRANISVVHSDLVNAKKKLMIFSTETGRFPVSQAELTVAGIGISGVDRYDIRPGYSNFYYCTDLDGEQFAVSARAAGRSASSYFVTSTAGMSSHAGLISQGPTCSKIGLTGTTSSSNAYSTSGLSVTGVVSGWLNN